jgi:hypothetical protein
LSSKSAISLFIWSKAFDISAFFASPEDIAASLACIFLVCAGVKDLAAD